MSTRVDPLDALYEHTMFFLSSEPKQLSSSHDNALIISLSVANVLLKRMLVDLGNIVNLFSIALIDMELEDQKIEDVNIALIGFLGE